MVTADVFRRTGTRVIQRRTPSRPGHRRVVVSRATTVAAMPGDWRTGGGGNRTRIKAMTKPQAGRAVTRYRLDFTSVRSPAPSRFVPFRPVLIPAGGAHWGNMQSPSFNSGR
jgi:hypothetical protein